MDPEHARTRLAEERARLESALADLVPDDDEELSHADQHPADQASELYTDERDAGMAERVREELEAIGRAEERLREGTYGRCVSSGEPIPDERLEVMPWAERTVAEQARYDGGR